MAVMSIVGYILGLGDRHMANIMLDRVTGRVIHIDFGDCFEVLKFRSMYPETIPFRLTRMLTKAMGTSGMAGTFKYTSYRVMRVLREHRDSVMAMLEAFVYDPMVSWRVLANNDEAGNAGAGAPAGQEAPGDNGEGIKGIVETNADVTVSSKVISEDGATTVTPGISLSASMSQADTARNVVHQIGWPIASQVEDQAVRNSLIQAMSSSSQDTAALLGGQYRGRVDEDGTPLMESSLSLTLRESISRRESLVSTQLPMGTGAAGALGAQKSLPIPTLTPSNIAVPTMPLATNMNNQDLAARQMEGVGASPTASATPSETFEQAPGQVGSVNAEHSR